MNILISLYTLIFLGIIANLYYILIRKRNYKFQIFFAYYDFWIGFYWDRDKRILYYIPIPCIVFSFSHPKNEWRNGKWIKKE